MVIAEILPEVLIGDYGDIRPELLVLSKTSLVLSVREEPFMRTRDPPYLSSTEVHNKAHVRFLWEPVKADPDENLELFRQEIMDGVYKLGRIKFVNGDTPRHLAQKTLVYCTAGMHRSPLVIAMHLYRHRKDELRGIFIHEYLKEHGKIDLDEDFEPTFERVCDYIQRKLREAGRPPAQFVKRWYEGMT